ncbi:MAG TPA: uroporphyrinogen-III synthase [Mycobacteriales bacterium]|nr:uroporphyrinogen-III synthase [Mycobacteriales bacterium]
MEELPLAGFTVAVTAARRREELSNLLVRRGARVVEAPAIRIIPTQDDDELRTATEACITQPPDVVIATTGIGFRGWMEAADGWGLGEPLRAQFAQAELLVRGPKAKGAVRAHGLAEAWSPESESTDEVLTHLLGQGVAGRRVALQLHGEPLPEVVAALTRAGATVVEIPVYRWVPAEDIRPVERLVDQLVSAQVDCVTFTSAPAVSCLLDVATARGKRPALLRALGTDVLAACVGPVTAARLEELGIATVQPERARLGALVRTVVEELPARRARTVRAGEHVLVLRGHSVLVDGSPVSLTTRQSAVLSALLDVGPGRVLSRSELLRRAWRDEPADEHAVEMTVARLRAALGPAGKAVETVVKRGYRLASQHDLDDVREM